MQNFHVKSILLGIGIGIVLTAFIGTIYSTGNEPVMDKDEIIERAKQFGMVFSEDLILGGTDQESQTTNEVSPTAVQQGNSDQVQSEEKKSSALSPENDQGVKTVENSVEEDVVISIQPGYTSEILANRLVDSGLIHDADSFVNHLVEMKLEGSIQVGNFRIRRGSDHNTIARAVTMTGR